MLVRSGEIGTAPEPLVSATLAAAGIETRSLTRAPAISVQLQLLYRTDVQAPERTSYDLFICCSIKIQSDRFGNHFADELSCRKVAHNTT